MRHTLKPEKLHEVSMIQISRRPRCVDDSCFIDTGNLRASEYGQEPPMLFCLLTLAEKRCKSTIKSGYTQVQEEKGLKRTLRIWEKSSNFAIEIKYIHNGECRKSISE